MDYAQLRGLLGPLVTALKDAGTHTMLPALCEELGLPAPAAMRDALARDYDAMAGMVFGKVPPLDEILASAEWLDRALSASAHNSLIYHGYVRAREAITGYRRQGCH